MDIKIILKVLKYLDRLNQDLDKQGDDSIPNDILNHASEIMDYTETLWIFGKVVKIKSLENRLEIAKIHDDVDVVKAVTAELKTLE